MAAFREIWDKFIGLCKSLYLVGSAVCINEQLLLFRGTCGFQQYMPKKPSKYGIKIWMMCDCATKYMMNAKVYLGKENNKVACGLASDVVCTLIQPVSGQDRGGRNVTTDNFFMPVDLANQLKNKKLTLVGTVKQNKGEIPQRFKPARQRDENSSVFGFIKYLTLVSRVPKKNKSVILLSSLHHDLTICSDSGKPQSIEFYNKTKGAVDMLDQMCAKYTVQRATCRWTMAMFYGMINIAAVNALVKCTHKMRKDQPEKKDKKERLFAQNCTCSGDTICNTTIQTFNTT